MRPACEGAEAVHHAAIGRLQLEAVREDGRFADAVQALDAAGDETEGLVCLHGLRLVQQEVQHPTPPDVGQPLLTTVPQEVLVLTSRLLQGVGQHPQEVRVQRALRE
jgi:hypothetical protein